MSTRSSYALTAGRPSTPRRWVRRVVLATACTLPLVPAVIAIQHTTQTKRAPAGSAAPSPLRAVTVAKVAPMAPNIGHVYVANYVDKAVSQYTVGPTGGLVPLVPPSLSLGGLSPGELGLTPSGHNLYISLGDSTGKGNDAIAQFGAGPDGTLSPMSPPTVPTASGPLEIVFRPDGKFLYVDNGGAGAISQYAIGVDGALSALVPPTVKTAGDAGELTMSPDGKFLYGGGNTIKQFSIDPTSGKLAPLSPATVGSPASDLKISPDGKFLYAGGFGISQYSIGANGQLTALSPAVAVATSGFLEIEVTGTGKFLYGTTFDNQGKSQIAQFSIGADGQLTALTPAMVPSGNIAYQVVISPDSKYLFVGNASFTTPGVPDTISQYLIGPNGSLTPLSPPTVQTGAGAGGLVATPPSALPDVALIPTTTSYTGPVAGMVGHVVPLSAKLTITATGAPIAAMSMRLTLNGIESCNATTNIGGSAACSVQPSEKAGSYPVTAAFAGTAVYAASSVSARFVLNAVPVFAPTVGRQQQPVMTTTTAAPSPVTTTPATTTRPPVVEVAIPNAVPTLPVTGGSNNVELAGLVVLLLALLGIGTARRVARAGSSD